MKSNLYPQALVLACALVASQTVVAAVLPKNILAVKEAFDQVGATPCSQAIADTLNSVATGRPFALSRQWSAVDTNKRSISIDFILAGDKENYSTVGSALFVPVGTQCHGHYIYTYVAPSADCKTYMHKEGFEGTEWVVTDSGNNGDGGMFRRVNFGKNTLLGFMFNDVAGGCSLTKRETVILDQKK